MTKKSIFSLVLLTFLALLSIGAFIISKNLMGSVNISENEEIGDEKINIKELIIIETKNGEKFWEIYADSGKYDNGTNIAVLSNIIGNFYKNEIVILSIVSPEAIYDSSKKEIKLQGGAEAANNKDIYIKADEICWSGAKDEITAKGDVKIIKENELMTISDESFFDSDFTNLKLSGNSNAYIFSIKKSY